MKFLNTIKQGVLLAIALCVGALSAVQADEPPRIYTSDDCATTTTLYALTPGTAATRGAQIDLRPPTMDAAQFAAAIASKRLQIRVEVVPTVTAAEDLTSNTLQSYIYVKQTDTRSASNAVVATGSPGLLDGTTAAKSGMLITSHDGPVVFTVRRRYLLIATDSTCPIAPKVNVSWSSTD